VGTEPPPNTLFSLKKMSFNKKVSFDVTLNNTFSLKLISLIKKRMLGDGFRPLCIKAQDQMLWKMVYTYFFFFWDIIYQQ
jgi:hypothetical protein